MRLIAYKFLQFLTAFEIKYQTLKYGIQSILQSDFVIFLQAHALPHMALILLSCVPYDSGMPNNLQ